MGAQLPKNVNTNRLTQEQDDFSGGINNTDNDKILKPNSVAKALNFDLTNEGKLQKRNGYNSIFNKDYISDWEGNHPEYGKITGIINNTSIQAYHKFVEQLTNKDNFLQSQKTVEFWAIKGRMYKYPFLTDKYPNGILYDVYSNRDGLGYKLENNYTFQQTEQFDIMTVDDRVIFATGTEILEYSKEGNPNGQYQLRVLKPYVPLMNEFMNSKYGKNLFIDSAIEYTDKDGNIKTQLTGVKNQINVLDDHGLLGMVTEPNVIKPTDLNFKLYPIVNYPELVNSSSSIITQSFSRELDGKFQADLSDSVTVSESRKIDPVTTDFKETNAVTLRNGSIYPKSITTITTKIPSNHYKDYGITNVDDIGNEGNGQFYALNNDGAQISIKFSKTDTINEAGITKSGFVYEVNDGTQINNVFFEKKVHRFIKYIPSDVAGHEQENIKSIHLLIQYENSDGTGEKDKDGENLLRVVTMFNGNYHYVKPFDANLNFNQSAQSILNYIDKSNASGDTNASIDNRLTPAFNSDGIRIGWANHMKSYLNSDATQYSNDIDFTILDLKTGDSSTAKFTPTTVWGELNSTYVTHMGDHTGRHKNKTQLKRWRDNNKNAGGYKALLLANDHVTDSTGSNPEVNNNGHISLKYDGRNNWNNKVGQKIIDHMYTDRDVFRSESGGDDNNYFKTGYGFYKFSKNGYDWYQSNPMSNVSWSAFDMDNNGLSSKLATTTAIDWWTIYAPLNDTNLNGIFDNFKNASMSMKRLWPMEYVKQYYVDGDGNTHNGDMPNNRSTTTTVQFWGIPQKYIPDINSGKDNFYVGVDEDFTDLVKNKIHTIWYYGMGNRGNSNAWAKKIGSDMEINQISDAQIQKIPNQVLMAREPELKNIKFSYYDPFSKCYIANYRGVPLYFEEDNSADANVSGNTNGYLTVANDTYAQLNQNVSFMYEDEDRELIYVAANDKNFWTKKSTDVLKNANWKQQGVVSFDPVVVKNVFVWKDTLYLYDNLRIYTSTLQNPSLNTPLKAFVDNNSTFKFKNLSYNNVVVMNNNIYYVDGIYLAKYNLYSDELITPYLYWFSDLIVYLSKAKVDDVNKITNSIMGLITPIMNALNNDILNIEYLRDNVDKFSDNKKNESFLQIGAQWNIDFPINSHSTLNLYNAIDQVGHNLAGSIIAGTGSKWEYYKSHSENWKAYKAKHGTEWTANLDITGNVWNIIDKILNTLKDNTTNNTVAFILEQTLISDYINLSLKLIDDYKFEEELDIPLIGNVMPPEIAGKSVNELIAGYEKENIGKLLDLFNQLGSSIDGQLGDVKNAINKIINYAETINVKDIQPTLKALNFDVFKQGNKDIELGADLSFEAENITTIVKGLTLKNGQEVEGVSEPLLDNAPLYYQKLFLTDSTDNGSASSAALDKWYIQIQIKYSDLDKYINAFKIYPSSDSKCIDDDMNRVLLTSGIDGVKAIAYWTDPDATNESTTSTKVTIAAKTIDTQKTEKSSTEWKSMTVTPINQDIKMSINYKYLNNCTKLYLRNGYLMYYGTTPDAKVNGYLGNTIFISDVHRPNYIPQFNTIDIQTEGTQEIKRIVAWNDQVENVVFLEKSIMNFKFSDPTNAAMSLITNEVGLWAENSAVAADNKIYFLSRGGVQCLSQTQMLNGLPQTRLVSKPIQDMFKNHNGEYPQDAVAYSIGGNYYLVCKGIITNIDVEGNESYGTRILKYYTAYQSKGNNVWYIDEMDGSILDIGMVYNDKSDWYLISSKNANIFHQTDTFVDGSDDSYFDEELPDTLSNYSIYNCEVISRGFNMNPYTNHTKNFRKMILDIGVQQQDIDLLVTGFIDNNKKTDPIIQQYTIKDGEVNAETIIDEDQVYSINAGTTPNESIGRDKDYQTWIWGTSKWGSHTNSFNEISCTGKGLAMKVQVKQIPNQATGLQILGIGAEYKIRNLRPRI